MSEAMETEIRREWEKSSDNMMANIGERDFYLPFDLTRLVLLRVKTSLKGDIARKYVKRRRIGRRYCTVRLSEPKSWERPGLHVHWEARWSEVREQLQ